MVDIATRKIFSDTPFAVETESVENEKGCWRSTKVSIFRNSILIGEYIRNYPNHGESTFCPFKIGDDWYALYSANYTCTRVMKLNDENIEDWCGEEPSNFGFCPIEYYVPHSAFGFLSGCVWGDDSSWKLRFIDLSNVPSKVLEITERFGYWELPNKPLAECVTVSSEDDMVLYLIKEECVRID